MTNRTPLHTRYETISRYHEIATDLLNALATDADNMMVSNDDEANAEPIRFLENRGEQLAIRMDAESWIDHTVQLLRDAMYLLAVGDNGATAVAEADPDRATKQAHDQRRRAAIERLDEHGLL